MYKRRFFLHYYTNFRIKIGKLYISAVNIEKATENKYMLASSKKIYSQKEDYICNRKVDKE
jgi:hypothetical protein